jgi:hypothetical protein
MNTLLAPPPTLFDLPLDRSRVHAALVDTMAALGISYEHEDAHAIDALDHLVGVILDLGVTAGREFERREAAQRESAAAHV